MVEVVFEGPAKNALGSELMREALGRVQAAEGAPLLIRGAGDSFSAGLNLKEILALDRDGMRGFLDLLGGLLDALWRYPGPTVAAVNGHAIAGGCLVALVCDHRVGTTEPTARIGLNEVALGLRFPPFVLRMIQARIGDLHLPEVVLGAGLHDPENALRLGFLDEITPDPVAVARERVALLGSYSAEVYAATKASLRPAITPTEAEQAAFAAEVVPLWASDALKERIRAVLNRKR